MGHRCAIALLLSCGLQGQGTPPRSAAADYPAHAALPAASIGAEYLVRSVSVRNRTFLARDHLVVEVALYPAVGQTVALSTGHFSLRMNGKKEGVAAQASQFVAAGFKYPDWERRPRLEALGGVNDRAVIVGRPEPRERFPGDPRPAQTRLPAPPRAPEAEAGPEREPPLRAEDAVIEGALLEGETSSARSGLLYFPFKG